MAKVSLTVSVDDENLNRFSEVAKECQGFGMEIQSRLDTLGLLTGFIDAEQVKSLSSIPGVASVEKSRLIEIPPPGNKLQ